MLLNIVYSTHSDNSSEQDKDGSYAFPPAEQYLSVQLDTKNRKGKEMTLIEGYNGDETALKKFAKMLKKQCGTGGTIEEGQVLLQGDQREKVKELLQDKGYNLK